MKRKNIFGIMLVLLVAWVIVDSQVGNKASLKTYENRKYGYEFKYASSTKVYVTSSNDYLSDIRDADDAQLRDYNPKYRDAFLRGDIRTYNQQLHVRVWAIEDTVKWWKESSQIIDEIKAIADTDLYTTAKNYRSIHIENSGNYLLGRNIGPIEEVTIGGHQGYQYSIEEGFAGPGSGSLQYMPFINAFVADPEGNRFMITYGDNLNSKRVVNSFRFIEK